MLLKETALIRLLGLTRIPMVFAISPRIEQLDEEGCAVRVPLRYLTKNHVGSMYLGTLAAGADLASGLNALRAIREGHPKVSLVFKDMKAEFLKRADGDVVFRCTQGRQVSDAVRHADSTGERVTVPTEVIATVPEKYGNEPVARFAMGLSLKRKD